MRSSGYVPQPVQRGARDAVLPRPTGESLRQKECNMKAYEFPCKVTPEGRLELPEALTKLLPANQVVRVIILLNEPTEREDEEAWARLTAEQFFAGYSEADAIYDEK